MLNLILSGLLLVGALVTDQGVEGSPIDGRIVGGNATSIVNFPYQVSLEYGGGHYCGGAIIARTWILTGASCLASSNPSNYRIRVGSTYSGTGGTLLNVAQLIPHSYYSNVDYDFDIALIQLETPVPLSESVQAIGLAQNGNSIVEGAVGTISGWGAVQEGGSAESVLRTVDVPIISLSVCREWYSDQYVSENVFCAGKYEGGVDGCSGDGGGPLVLNSVLAGTISWGLGCGRPQNPGVYTNVGLYRDWITEHTGI